MTKWEISNYLAMASVALANESNNEPEDEVMVKLRQALLEAQVILVEAALREANESNK